MSNKRKKVSGALGSFVTVRQPDAPKCIGAKLACLDTVYAERDRDEFIRGYHYIYRCKEVKQSARGTTYICVFLNERIKANSPKAMTVPHRDVDNPDHEEIQEFDAKTFEAGRSRWKDHKLRMNAVQRDEQSRKAAAIASAASMEVGGKSECLSPAELEALHCADLMEFVNTYGVEGKNEAGERFLDLHWKPAGRFTIAAQKVGAPARNMVRRENVSTKKTIETQDTGSVWTRVRSTAKKAEKTPDVIRSK
jgi:hypothetical protein